MSSTTSSAITSGTKIGAIAKPRTIIFTPDLPKTTVGEDHATAAP